MDAKQIFDNFTKSNELTEHYYTVIKLITMQTEYLSSDKQRQFARTVVDEILQHEKITYKSVMTLLGLLSQIELNKYKSEKVVKELYV